MKNVILLFAAGCAHHAQSASSREEPGVTMEQARVTALAQVDGEIVEQELEREQGRLVYSFDIKIEGGVKEVEIDAHDGSVVRVADDDEDDDDGKSQDDDDDGKSQDDDED